MKNKCVSFILAISLLVSSICVLPVDSALADSEETNVLAQYTGTTSLYNGAYRPTCTFTIYNISNGRFRGYFHATIQGYSQGVDQSIAGEVYDNYDSFTCVFSLSNFYNTTCVITVFPYEGYCECISSGTWHFADFRMDGTAFTNNTNSEISGNSTFNESDLKMCMDLSKLAYEKWIFKKQNLAIKNWIETNNLYLNNNFNINSDSLVSYNYKDKRNKKESDRNNVAFNIIYRDIGDNSADMIVAIRGTYYDEWIGNTEITGTDYNSQTQEHDNFRKAKNSIKQTINDYISKHLSKTMLLKTEKK